MTPHPHLAPELQGLPDELQRLWGDAVARRAALAAVAAAWECGDLVALASSVALVDAAVVAGLDALGLPRGRVNLTSVERVGRGWLGQKRPDSHLVFDGEVLVSALRVQRQPDDVFRTWVHESLHARQSYVLPATELRAYRGYEEGLVEGLARLVTRDRAGMDILEASYPAYVITYRAIAAVARVDVEALWRVLWRHPAGAVRAAFVGVVADARRSVTGRAASSQQRIRLQGIADRAFASGQGAAIGGDQAILERTFEVAFR